MENNSTYDNSAKRPILFVLTVLMVPIIFAMTMLVITYFASALGLFYIRLDELTLVTVLLFPLSWIFLGIRHFHPQIATHFAYNVGSILLIWLTISATIETVSVHTWR